MYSGQTSSREGPRGVETVFGDNAAICPFTAIHAGTTTRHKFPTGQAVCTEEDNIIGHRVSVGANSAMEIGKRSGGNVGIHSNSFSAMVRVEDSVIIAPSIVFINRVHTPCR